MTYQVSWLVIGLNVLSIAPGPLKSSLLVNFLNTLTTVQQTHIFHLSRSSKLHRFISKIRIQTVLDTGFQCPNENVSPLYCESKYWSSKASSGIKPAYCLCTACMQCTIRIWKHKHNGFWAQKETKYAQAFPCLSGMRHRQQAPC